MKTKGIMGQEWAYYNEYDKDKAAWLRELQKEGVIAPGEVDERSITDVDAKDVMGFTQCHWFAGIGVWSYALRQAGWPDNRNVWTFSCPCPPFSVAGKTKTCPRCDSSHLVPDVRRTGQFVCVLCDHEWFADARHLWPEMWRLVRDGRPDIAFGEQVASSDGRIWFASVRASLEILDYAAWGLDLCSAGVGATDIRQRFFFVADAGRHEPQRWHGLSDAVGAAPTASAESEGTRANRKRAIDDVANGSPSIAVVQDDGDSPRCESEGQGSEDQTRDKARVRRSKRGRGPNAGSVGQADGEKTGRRQGRPNAGRSSEEPRTVQYGLRPTDGGSDDDTVGQADGNQPRRPWSNRPQGPRLRDAVERCSDSNPVALGDGIDPGLEGWQGNEECLGQLAFRQAGFTNGFWRDAVWIRCLDTDKHGNHKYRAIASAESLPFEVDDGLAADLGLMRYEGEAVFWPTVEKSPNRNMRIRGYGDAINAVLASTFIESVLGHK